MLTLLTKAFLGRVIKMGELRVILPSGAVIEKKGLKKSAVTLRFQRWWHLLRIFVSPSLGFGEYYADNKLKIENGGIYDLLYQLLHIERHATFPWLMLFFARIRGYVRILFEGWTIKRSRKNVHHHYDLGNKLYALFLDEDWQYSCAYFDEKGISLEEAQRRKKNHIMRKLLCDKDKTVLDIGSGWGGMALHLAPHVASVKGITLSDEQIAYAKQRTKDKVKGKGKNKANNVTFQIKDYREEKGKFDRVVSVGMLEHVGEKQYGRFFKSVSDCLNDDGVALIHTITRRQIGSRKDDFIDKYIFPGGYLPVISQLSGAIEKTDLTISDAEVLFLHYAETLRHWRMRFLKNRKKVVELYDERFARIWEFYLAASEASFRAGIIMVCQLQLLKPAAKAPNNRRYLYNT